MTDIGRMAHVVPARTQLPVSAYFDEARFAREQELIFKQSSLYVGHQKLVPELGIGVPWSRRTAAARWCATSRAWSWSPMSAATARP
ncbi:iron-sulfur protein [Bordetella pertussis]|nr:iron-sulfur protein [Bordetella pertussis]